MVCQVKWLQEIELKLNRLRKGEEGKLRQIRGAERKIGRIDEELHDLERARVQRQREADQLTHQVKSREESILRHREELLSARTNMFYAAILTEIYTEKADTEKIETIALEKLGELEKIQGEIDTRQQEKTSVAGRMDSAQAALERYREETAEERNTLREMREGASASLPSSALATFARVAERHEGEALAEVVKLQPRREEYACSGCNMQVPLDSVNALRSRDEILFCPNCARIQYVAMAEGAGRT